MPAIIASLSSTLLEHEAGAFGGTRTPQMREGGVAFR
jgi:hypothetical protein